MRRKAIVLAVTGVLLLALAVLPVAAQETTGAVGGTVTDATGAVIPGAEITITGLGIDITTTSDGSGAYAFRGLQVGTYIVQVTFFGFKTTTVTGVKVEAGKTTRVNTGMEVGGVAETIEVISSAVIVDTTSSKSMINIGEDLMDVLPHGRGYLSMMQLAPGVRPEPLQGGGFQVDGASAGENTFSIEGQNNTHIRTGQSALDPPTDFFQEVTIKSSGFEAEFGGALGGVINASTKKGGSAWHGAGVLYYRQDDLDAAPNAFIRQDPSSSLNSTGPRQDRVTEIFDPREDEFRTIEPGFEIGGPIFGEQLQFFGSYIPRLNKNERFVNVPGQGPTGFLRTQNTHFALGRLDSRPHETTNIHATWNYAYSRTRGISRPSRDGLDGEANGSAGGTFRPDRGDVLPNLSWNIGGDWTPTTWLTVSSRVGLWNTDRQNRGLPTGTRHFWSEGAVDAAGNPIVGLNGVPVRAESALVQGSFNIGSNFQTLFDEFERESFGVDAAFFFNAAGTHSVKVGWARDELKNNVNRSSNTAFVQLHWDDFFTPNPGQVAACAPIIAAVGSCRGNFGWYTVRDFKTFGLVSSENLSFYIQDSWNIGGRLTLNIGVRFDDEFLPSFAEGANVVAKPIVFSFSDKVAPRLGASFDVFGDGKMKIFGSWGRFFDIMKFELPRGSFGGDFWHNCFFTLDTDDLTQIQPGSDADGFTCRNGTFGGTPGTFLGEEDFRIPSNIVGNIDNIIDPNLDPMRQTEFTLGGEYQLTNDIGLEVRYARKRLDKTIEDAGIRTAAGEQFFIVNPGFGINEFPLANDCDTCGTLPGSPKAVREYDGLEFRFNKRFTNNWFTNASYTWSDLFGNYSGLTSTDEAGRASPNVNRFFDELPMLFDQNGQPVFGQLPTDRTHTFKFFGGYQLNWAGMATTISTNQLIYSGTPVSTTLPFTFAAPIFPWGRGTSADLSRDPVTGDIILDRLREGSKTPQFTQTDFNIRHEFKLSDSNEALRFQIEFNVINAFNEKNIVGFHGEAVRGSLRSIGQFVQFNVPVDPVTGLTTDPSSLSQVDWARFFNGFDMLAEVNARGFTLESVSDGGHQPERFQAPRTLRFKFAVVF